MIPWEFEGAMDYQCPARVWLDEPQDMTFLLDVHAHYCNGFLPVEGAILDQPAKLMDAMTIAGNELADCREEAQAIRNRQGELERHQNEVEARGQHGRQHA